MLLKDSSLINSAFIFLYHTATGTKNIIDACIELKVKRLVYTSSPSVVFDGVRRIFNGDESLPYPAKLLNCFDLISQQYRHYLYINDQEGSLKVL